MCVCVCLRVKEKETERARERESVCVFVCVCVDALDMKDKVRVLTDPPNWQIGWCVETHEKNSLK